jgi:hypothetical protein
VANEERGEIDWVVGSKTYVLRLGINAICALEAKQTAAARAEADAKPKAPRAVHTIAPGEKPEEFLARVTVLAKLAEQANQPPRVTFDQILNHVRDGSMTDAVELLWAALQRYHKKQFPTIEHVGDLIDEAGGPRIIVGQVNALIDRLLHDNKAPAELEEADGGGGKADPPGAQVGIGSDSTSMLVGSA